MLKKSVFAESYNEKKEGKTFFFLEYIERSEEISVENKIYKTSYLTLFERFFLDRRE